MIELKNVEKKFGNNVILSDINCSIPTGLYGLLGPNGAGKTTLMRCMTDLYSINKGKIIIDGKPNTKVKKNGIGYLPQNFGLFKELTVDEIMMYFCNLKGIEKKDRKDQVDRALHIVNMEKNRKKFCGKLSGGMVRRVGIAQALLGHPNLILLDEPTVGLDPEERRRFKDAIIELGKDQDQTILMSTHIVEDVDDTCENVILMKDGKITQPFLVEELKKKEGTDRLEDAYLRSVANM
mgnify:FL=1